MQEQDNVVIPELDMARSVCRQLLTQVADGMRGITPSQEAWLLDYHQKYKLLVKHCRNNGQLSKTNLATIQPLIDQKVSFVQAYVGFELADAMKATFEYLTSVDPIQARDRLPMRDEDKLRLATKANIEFADFFIKVGNQFGLKDGLKNLFIDIFSDPNVEREFTTTGVGNFISGIGGMVEAYRYVRNEFPAGTIRVGSLEEDLHQGTDMVWEPQSPGEQMKIFEVKAGKLVTVVQSFDLLNHGAKERLQLLNQTCNPQESARRNGSLDKILAAASEHNHHPYWIEAPSYY